MSREKIRNVLEIVAGVFLMVTLVPWLMLVVHIVEKLVR